MLSKVGSAVCSLAAVLSLQLLWCSTSAAQSNTTTLAPPQSNSTDLPPGTTMLPPGTTVLPLEAIVGIAVGGTALLAFVLCCCVCLCCCCCIRRRRKKSYDPGPTQLSTTLTYNSSPSDMNGFHDNKANEHDFEMQMNIADSSVMVSGTVFADSVETDILTTRQVTASNPQPTDKGYVKMSSAASALLSPEEVDGIYLSADTPISADITQSGGRPPVSSLMKSSSSRERLEEPVELDVDGQEDLYVEADVFVQDREQQDSDLYYNKDTIETIRLNRSLINVVDPVQTHTVYANIDPPPTPEHTLKPTEDYESIDEFLSNSRAPSPPSDTEAEYYNFKPPSTVQDDDYNYVDVAKTADTENPYLLEDNEYMYMSRTGSKQVDQQTTASTTEASSSSYQNLPDFVGTDGARSRMDSKGYTHLDYEGGERPVVGQSASLDNKKSKSNVMAELNFPPKTGTMTSGSSDTKKRLYVNLLPEDGGDELYEELS